MHTHGTIIIQEIPASHLEKGAEMLSLCLNTNHAQDTWFAVKIKSAYTQPIIKLTYVLSAFSA